jgi:acyl-coenzyme A thioesterase PaaI-like protein
MEPINKLGRIVARFDKLPGPLRSRAITVAMRQAVPFVGTAGVRLEEMTRTRLVGTVPNRRRAQNHIKGVHAAAMALLAETCTGLVVGMNVPDDRLPVIKTMKVDYVKRTQGALRAEATLTPAQIDEIVNTEKGETTVAVTVTDESGREPVICEMIWAWIPKKR